MTDDQDPTGMSHLLAGLKETGPMPDDLNERITAALADEQAARGDTDDSAEDLETASVDSGDPTHERPSFWSAMDEDGSGPSRRSSTAGRWVLGIAAAAVVVMGVGGIFAIRGGDDAADSAGSTQTAQSGASDEAPATSGSGAPSEVPAFAVTETGTDYDQESLGSEAAALYANPEKAKELTDPSVLGSLSSAAGAKDCLSRLGHPELQPVVIDVARFEGTPGVLVIAEPVPEGTPQAWALTTGCEEIWSGPTEVSQD